MQGKPSPKDLPEAIQHIDHINKQLLRLSNEVNLLNLKWTFLTTYLHSGHRIEEALEFIRTQSHRTNERLLKGITMMQGGQSLEEVLTFLNEDINA